MGGFLARSRGNVAGATLPPTVPGARLTASFVGRQRPLFGCLGRETAFGQPTRVLGRCPTQDSFGCSITTISGHVAPAISRCFRVV